MPTSILITKLYTPPRPAEFIARPRLIERLNKGLTRKLTLISAPAGFGKTTLTVDWLHTRSTASTNGQSPRSAWLALDEADNDPTRFFTYLVTSLQQMFPNVGHNALTLLDAAQLPPIETLLTTLINDLAGVLADKNLLPQVNYVLVLDDYHVIETKAVHEIVTFMLNHMPPQTHLVLTSRADPPLSLARLRARRQLNELRINDLRFTIDETTTFLNQVMGLNLSTSDVTALESRTEGWIAGLQLAAISLQGRENVDNFINAFTGSHQFILDYLAEEVIYSQPEHLQHFLLQTAILDRLNGPLCDAVTDRSDSQTTLEKLAQSNLFIMPLDDQRYWYRYHHLFADLLRHYLHHPPASFSSTLIAKLKEENIAVLYRRAAVWFEDNGFIEEAVKHTLLAKDFERATRLIEHNFKKMIIHGKANLVKQWLNTLPPHWIEVRPSLYLAHALIAFMGGKLDEAEQALKNLEHTFQVRNLPEAEYPNVLAQATFIAGEIALMRGEVTKSIDLLKRSLDNLVEDEIPIRDVAMLNLAKAYRVLGDIETAGQLMSQINHSKSNASNKLKFFMQIINQAEHYTFHGQLRQAVLLHQQFFQLLQENKILKPPPSVIALFHIKYGELLYEQNNLEAALVYIDKGFEIGKQGVYGSNQMMGYMNLAKIHQAQGDFDRAFQVLNQALALKQDMGLGPDCDQVKAMQVRLWLAQGNLIAAEKWVQKQSLDFDDEFNYLREFEYITLARLLMAQNQLEAARQLLEQLLKKAEEAERLQSTIEILILQSLIHQAQDNLPQAKQMVERALVLAEPEGYIRLFLDEGGPMAALLVRLWEKYQQNKHALPPTLTYLTKLLDAFGLTAIVPTQDNTPFSTQPLVEPLTERELEILQLMTDGLSNRKIAEKLVVSENTVKTHARNIFGKLSVRSRVQAIAKGKELELL